MIAAATELRFGKFINAQNKQERRKNVWLNGKRKLFMVSSWEKQKALMMDIEGNGWNEENSSLKHKAFCEQLKKQTLRVNAMKYSVDKTSNAPLSRLCNEKAESITHIVSACWILAKRQYRKCHDKVGTYVHWLLCKEYHSDKWYTYKPQSVHENDKCK